MCLLGGGWYGIKVLQTFNRTLAGRSETCCCCNVHHEKIKTKVWGENARGEKEKGGGGWKFDHK